MNKRTAQPASRGLKDLTERARLIGGIELIQAIERHGSISKAATSLGITQPVASKYLLAFEELVGVPLFKRTTRSLSPSEAGQLALQGGKELLSSADALLARIKDQGNRSGTLKIASSPLFGKKHLLPHLQKFRDTQPGVEIRLILNFEDVDLIRDDVDLKLHIGHLPDRRLVASRIAAQRRILCAAPDYEARRGKLQSPEDLSRHPCLLHTVLASNGMWNCKRDKSAIQVHVGGPMASNSSDALAEAAVQGWGLSLLPSWAVFDYIQDGRLVEILPEWSIDSDAQARDISFVWVPELSQSKALRNFVDYFAQLFGRPPYWDQPQRAPNQK